MQENSALMGLEVTTEKYLIMSFLTVQKGFQGNWLAPP